MSAEGSKCTKKDQRIDRRVQKARREGKKEE